MPALRPTRLALAALLCAGLTACGSTVQLAGEVPVDTLAVDPGTGLPAVVDPATGALVPGGQPGPDAAVVVPDAAGAPAVAPGAGPGAVPGPGSTGTGGSSGSAGSGPAPAAPGAGSGGAPVVAAPAPGAVPAKGPGWDERFVYIGVTTQKDVQAAADGVGAKGLDAGDQEAQALATAAEVNRGGGILGREVKVVFKDQQTVATASDPNTAGAAACTFFSQDKPVIAVLNPVTLMDVPSFRSCLAKARIPLFSASVAAVDAKVGRDLAPFFYQSVAPAWDSLAPVFVARLKAQKWFDGWDPRAGRPVPGTAKVGVLTSTDDVGIRAAAVVKRAFEQAGSKGVVTFSASGDYSGAVLQFAGNGVTHVVATNSDLVGFQLSAATQGYRPRYGIHSLNAPVTFLEANSPDGQNDGALGVGWAPSLDVNDRNDKVTTPGEKTCKDIMTKGGQSFSGKRLAEAVAFAFCDGIRLMDAAAEKGGGFSGEALFRGVQGVGPSFSAAFSFGSGLGPSTLYVPGAVRDLRWDSACDCSTYAGSTVTTLRR